MTALVRWSPFPELDVLERRMRRTLEDMGLAPAPLPAADLYETDGEFVVALDVPGFEESELEIEVSDHTLTVTGERKEAKQEEGKEYMLHERVEQRFARRFELPVEADLDHVKAMFRKGVLEVHAPKAEPIRSRTIEIEKE